MGDQLTGIDLFMLGVGILIFTAVLAVTELIPQRVLRFFERLFDL